MSDKQVLPLLIVKRGTVSKRDIARAEKSAFILIIESDDPEQARFVHPPVESKIEAQAAAALSLMRVLIYEKDKKTLYEVGSLVKWWARLLMNENQPPEVMKAKP